MSSFFNKLKRKSSADKISIGSNSSLFGSGSISFCPYTVNEKQLHPFLKAVWKNDLGKVKKLMKKHYNQIDQEKRSGFHLACATGNLEIIKEFMSNYRNEMLEKKDGNNKTGLYKAVEKGILENIQYLIEKSAKTDVKDDKGETIIHASIRYKHLEVLQYLLNKGVDLNEASNTATTPLHLTAELNFLDGMKLLIDLCPNIDAVNNHGKTALIIATESGHENSVRLLLSSGANKDITDKDGFTALHYAEYHQQTQCINLLQNVDDNRVLDPTPKPRATLEAPEFIAAINPDATSNSTRFSQNEGVKARPKTSEQNRDSKNKRSVSKESINSNSSWMGDFQSLSSEATNPVSHNSIAINDISTPSSMLNPSDMMIDKPRTSLVGSNNKGLKKQMSDEESQWSDSDNSENEVNTPVHGKEHDKIQEKNHEKESNKNTDSDWDSDDTEHQNVQVELSTIDEESVGKPSHIGSVKSQPLIHGKNNINHGNSEVSLLAMPINEDGHQTDSNIEECFLMNQLVTHPPVRYESEDTLNNSMDEGSENDSLEEMYTSQMKGNKKKEKPAVFPARPPRSPSVKTPDKSIPTITVEEVTPKKRQKYSSQPNGDNLSYSSSEFDMNSRQGSLAESDSLNDGRKANAKSIDEYMKRCAQLESRLRDVESEKAKLQLHINSVNESNKKSEAKNSRMADENQNLEAKLSEKSDELDDFKAKFFSAKDQLKKREKDLLEIRNEKVEIENNYNDLEIKNISLNSKIKQLQEELDNSQLHNSNSHNHQEDAAKSQQKYKEDLEIKIKTNEKLKLQIDDLRQQLLRKEDDLDTINSEHESKIRDLQNQISSYKETIQKEIEEKDSLQEEIDQLRKTIKTLNSDLETSSKAVSQLTKKEKEIDELKKGIEEKESRYCQLSLDKENLTKSSGEKEKKINSLHLEVERWESQLKLKDDRIYHLELQYKTYESQSKELEKLVEKKNNEIREYEKKFLDSDIELKKEIKKSHNALELVNDAINTALNDTPDSTEILEKLQDVRKSMNSSDAFNGASISQMKLSNHEADLSIELSKSRSQIRVLQEQIEQMRNTYLNKDHSSNEDNQSDIEAERIDKLEGIERQLCNDLQNKSRVIQQNHQELTQLDRENTQLKENLKEEKQKYQLIQEKDKSLSIQLRNEIKKKKQLSETLDSVKYCLDKYSKQINVPSSNQDHLQGVLHAELTDNMYSTIPQECSTLLQVLSETNDEIKAKLKKLEMENSEHQNRKTSSEKSQEMFNENSQFLLNQQLAELTQMMENQRMNREKLERIRDENEFQLRNELYQTKQQKMMEISQLSAKLAAIEEERKTFVQKIEYLNETLMKERQLKDSLTEQMVNFMKTSNHSNQQSYGYEPSFQNGNGFTTSLSQFNTPISAVDFDKKRYANSMLNLSIIKPIGIEDEDLRQKLRQELDRSITKHLESGKPIQQLNIKEKIRSLNVGRYMNGTIPWKSP